MKDEREGEWVKGNEKGEENTLCPLTFTHFPFKNRAREKESEGGAQPCPLRAHPCTML